MSLRHKSMHDLNTAAGGTPPKIDAEDLTACSTPQAAFTRIAALYEAAANRLRDHFRQFAAGSTAAVAGACYPCLAADIRAQATGAAPKLAYGKVAVPGLYVTTLTAPHLFKDYLLEQMRLLSDNYEVTFWVGTSRTPIPLSYAIEHAAAALSDAQRLALPGHFDLPNLGATNDDIADGIADIEPAGPSPLSLFPAERVDYSLHRLSHYTATRPEYFQKFVLFTNYQRYVDEFIELGRREVESGRYEAFVEPGNRISRKGAPPAEPPLVKLPQMPAYHLTGGDNMGITLVNIGIGPSNAKTITDHIAVLRPHVWLMVGHCGGLRRSQTLGDYVLAHAYLRDDNVLDRALPVEIPLPTIAEVQLALSAAVGEVTGAAGSVLKQRLRTGTVVTTDDRNWELRFHELALRFNQSRAIAIDMESATIAANGYRFRVPYGTLLCVSDRPLHGEIKLPGMANAFYEERIGQHLQIGIRALELLRAEAAAGTLHSRKLRSFNEPAFR